MAPSRPPRRPPPAPPRADRPDHRAHGARTPRVPFAAPPPARRRPPRAPAALAGPRRDRIATGPSCWGSSCRPRCDLPSRPAPSRLSVAPRPGSSPPAVAPATLPKGRDRPGAARVPAAAPAPRAGWDPARAAPALRAAPRPLARPRPRAAWSAGPPAAAAPRLGCAAMPTCPGPPDDVKAFVEERDIRFIRSGSPTSWAAEVVLDQRRGARRRLRARHGLRRLLHDRLQPDRGVGHDRRAGPATFAPPALAPRRDGASRACSPTSTRPSARPMRATRATSCAAPWNGCAGHGLRQLRGGPELEYFSSATPRRPRSSTRAATSTSPRSTPAPTCAARPCSRSSSWASGVEYTHHEVGPSQHEIDLAPPRP